MTPQLAKMLARLAKIFPPVLIYVCILIHGVDHETEMTFRVALILYLVLAGVVFVVHDVVIAMKAPRVPAASEQDRDGNPVVPERRRFAVGRAARNVLCVFIVAAIPPIAGMHLPAPWNDIYFGVTIVGILSSALVFWICKLGRIQ